MWLAGFETHRAIAFVWKNKNLDLSYQRGSVEVVFKTRLRVTEYKSNRRKQSVPECGTPKNNMVAVMTNWSFLELKSEAKFDDF